MEIAEKRSQNDAASRWFQATYFDIFRQLLPEIEMGQSLSALRALTMIVRNATNQINAERNEEPESIETVRRAKRGKRKKTEKQSMGNKWKKEVQVM